MKRLGMFILIVIFGVVLISCKKDVVDDKEESFIEVLAELSDIYADGDSEDSVTQALNFRSETTKLEGVKITWTSNKPNVVSNTGFVLRGPEDTLVTITLDLKKEELLAQKIFIVTVKAEVIEEYQKVQYTETFDNLVLSGQYKTLIYPGINDIDWNVTHARSVGDYQIDGIGVVLSGANIVGGNQSSLSAIFPHGLIDFSFEYMKALTGKDVRNYVVEITNNDFTQTDVLPDFGEGSGAQETVYKYNYNGPELEGEVKVKIKSVGATSNKQATFDNFSWREYNLIPEGQIRHTVAFDTAGGIPIQSVKIVDGEVMDFIPTPTKEGFDFVEWHLDNEPFDGTKIITKQTILVAKWESAKNTVITDLGYVEVSNVESFLLEIGEAFPKPYDPDRQGYTFIGWYQFFNNIDNHTQYDFSEEVTTNIRLIAKWQKDMDDPEYTRDDNDLGSYYDPIIGQTGEELVLSLRTILTTSQTGVNYNKAKTALEITDRHPHNDTMVLGIYDRAMYVGPWKHPNWEREHVWPNSKLGVERASENTINQASDLHNLRAILPIVNGRRSNRYFVNPTEPLYSPIGHIVGDSEGTYYPGDEDIGDVARIFLYMAVRYEVLKLTDDTNLLRLGDNDKNNNEEVSAYMGTLSLLFDWHLKDPVDEFEIRRNDLINGYQGNRNPFIDHPELFEEVHSYFMQVDIDRNTSTVSFVINDNYVVHIDYLFFRKQINNEFVI